MHVHAIIDTLYSGGAENLLIDFATGARRRGVRTTVSYLSVHDTLIIPRLQELGIEPRPVDVRHLSPHAVRLVRADLAEVAPDIVHTHLISSDFLGALAGRSLGIPVVSTLHSASPPPGGKAWLRERLAAWGRHRGAARVIAVSDAARRQYLEHGWESPERVVTVHNGIVATQRSGAGPAIRRELGIGEREIVVATVSVLKPGKGHRVAIQLVAELRSRGVPVRLLILGEGPLRSEIDEQVRVLGEHGQLLGHRDDVLAVLDAVDILVHPSEADAFPGALLEAMAARVPILASDVGGIPEIVVDGESGLLVAAPATAANMLEPMLRLCAEPEQRAALAEAGRARLDQNFTVERWMERLLPLYERVIRDH